MANTCPWSSFQLLNTVRMRILIWNRRRWSAGSSSDGGGMPTHGDLFRISEEWATGRVSSRRDFISRAQFWDDKLRASFLVRRQSGGKDVDPQLAGCIPSDLCLDQRTAQSLSPQRGGLPDTAHKELTSNQQPPFSCVDCKRSRRLNEAQHRLNYHKSVSGDFFFNKWRILLSA